MTELCANGDIGTPPYIQYDCFNYPLVTPPYFRQQQCLTWPLIGQNSYINTSTFPYRVPFDFKAGPGGSIINESDFSGPRVRQALDTSCQQLNTKFPGCSTTDGCQWAYQTLGRTDISGRWQDCGVARSDENFGFCPGIRCCNMDASFCYRTAFDETYKTSCINQTLETDFGLSLSVWIQDAFWNEEGVPLTQYQDGTFSNASFTSQSYSPYVIYCDPEWCAFSPSADALNFEICQNSITIVDGQQRHAALAPGRCNEWYSISTADYQFGLHNWQLIDTMIENYCQNTPYSVDSFSCNCVGGQPGGPLGPSSNYFVSCSVLDISNGDCPNGIAPVRAAIDAPGPPQLLANALCANIACLQATNGTGAFATRNIYQQRVACPTASCFLAILGTDFSANNITGSQVYLSSKQQFCNNINSITGNAPKYTLQDFPTVWFWSNLKQEVLNPSQPATINLRNTSLEGTNLNYTVTFAQLPSWLTYRGADLNGNLAPGNVSQFTLVQNAQFAPQSASIPFTFTALNGTGTFSSEVINLDVAVIAIDKLQPSGPQPGPDTNPNDIPLLVSNTLSPGGLALLLISILLVILAVVLYMQGTNIQNTALRYAP